MEISRGHSPQMNKFCLEKIALLARASLAVNYFLGSHNQYIMDSLKYG